MNTPFQESTTCKSIQQHYRKIQQKPVKIKEAELPILETIMANSNFENICEAFNAIEEYFGYELKSADPTFVELKLSQIDSQKQQNDRLCQKLQLSIQKIQETIFSLQQYNDLIISKYNWLQKQVHEYEESLPDIKEEIQIIKSQNQKLKANKKSSIKSDDSLQLKELLKEYRCNDKPFPRNKTEALMLINRIQSMIQQAQMNKLSNYMLEP